jgi:hypothetical protein
MNSGFGVSEYYRLPVIKVEKHEISVSGLNRPYFDDAEEPMKHWITLVVNQNNTLNY